MVRKKAQINPTNRMGGLQPKHFEGGITGAGQGSRQNERARFRNPASTSEDTPRSYSKGTRRGNFKNTGVTRRK